MRPEALRHPDLVWIAPNYLLIGVPPAFPQLAMIERHAVVALRQLTRLEPIPVPAGDGASG
jgi:hypothetical protein